MLQSQIRSEIEDHNAQRLTLTFARSSTDIEDAQRLRYKVFAEEKGANIPCVNGLDVDKFDEYCRHLIVRDEDTGRVVGCYRLLTADGARALNGWYSEAEFDLNRIAHLLPRVVELGRACVDKDYRTGSAVMMLWSGLVQFMYKENLSHMIGCASVCMSDGGHVAASLYNKLAKNYLAPQEYHVFPHVPLPIESLDQTLNVPIPALIKGYMRAGAYICGKPAWDADFNSADMLVMLPLSRLTPRYMKHLSR